MKILLINQNQEVESAVITHSQVTITELAVGPILTNEDFNVSIFARDDGFEGYFWKGDPDHKCELTDAMGGFRITPADLPKPAEE